jgi:prepilin-type N-terminal cleavage/methylation domain-containing protein
MNKERNQGVCQRDLRPPAGFTLIELLVVISIIALLVSILMPALGKAREQAMLVTCGANCKQIGLTVQLYRADNNDAVPMVYNAWTPVFARGCLVSVALRDYLEKHDPLPPELDPDTAWAQDFAPGGAMLEYCQRYLPEFFVCPSSRGKGPSVYESTAPVDIGGEMFTNAVRKGVGESYVTWLHRVPYGVRGVINCPDHPLGLPHGQLKYGELNWHTGWERGIWQPWADYPSPAKQFPAKWTKHDLKVVNCGSYAEATILYCEQGQTSSWANDGTNRHRAVMNFGSHRKGDMGGTNAIFADNHVEWVPGTQIGWP